MGNWKTTLAGIFAGGASLFSTPVHGWQQWLTAIMITAIGVLAKDHNVTGGSVQQ